MRFILSVFAIVPALTIGCSGTADTPETTVQGTALTASYPSTPRAVVARDESGQTRGAAQLAGGTFALSLPSGHTYALFVNTDGGDVPIVFPRASGKLDASFIVRSRGAIVRLGAIRYLTQAPAAGFQFAAQDEGDSGPDCNECADDNHDVECHDDSPGINDTAGVDPAHQADGTHELAVPRQNAPESVDGCGPDEPNGDNNNAH